MLHRDLKPGNIMLGPYGETLVVDWGLAKAGRPARGGAGATAEATLRPGVGSGVERDAAGLGASGTPAYMSPEQAAGRLDRLGPASDVYSLGATLYCLLTGRPPFEGRRRRRRAAAGAAGRVPAAAAGQPGGRRRPWRRSA